MNPDAPEPADDRRGTFGVGPDGGWQIRFERHLRHAPERVWQALVDPAQQDRWMPGVRIEAAPGGAVVFDFGDEGRADGEVVAIEPPAVLEHSWLWPGEPPATVRWEVRPEGTGTHLVLLHRPVRPEAAVDYRAGWHAMLDTLDVYVSGGDPADHAPDYERLYALYRAEAARG